MRLAHVIYHLGVGGGEQFLADLVRPLAVAGWVQHVWCVGPRGPLAAQVLEAGVPVTAVGKRTRLGAGAVLRLAAELARFRPDVVQVHGEAGALWGLPAARLARCRHCVALVYQNAAERAVLMAATRGCLRLAGHVIAGGASVARFAQERLGVPADRMSTILCGVDTARIPAARREWPGRPTLLTIGRLVGRKGQRTAIEALARVRRLGLDARLVIAGDGPARADLERCVRALQLEDAVEFRGTVWPDTPLWREADVFVFPSHEEPQGLVVLEAFAAGVPVVASATGGIEEMVTPEDNGLLCPPGDAEALADAVLRVSSDAPLRARLVAGGRRSAPQHDIGRVAAAYHDLYSSRCLRHAFP